MRVLESIVSQKSGNGRISDKELAERVLQYVPDVYSTTTLRVLCASTRYLSSIDALEHFFDVDSEVVQLTDSCKIIFFFNFIILWCDCCVLQPGFHMISYD